MRGGARTVVAAALGAGLFGLLPVVAHSAELRRCDIGIMMADANLSRCNFAGADLAGADLRRTDLTNADLSGARLSNARLIDATLSGANLADADVTGAALDRARMINTILRRAVLSDASLAGAQLSWSDARGAILHRAVLRGADVSNADLSTATLARADLSRVLLVNTDLRDAALWNRDIGSANICQAYFEPSVLPPARELARAENLWSLRFIDSQRALWAAREDFKREGLRTAERQVTFAMLRTRGVHAWFVPVPRAAHDDPTLTCSGDLMFDRPWPSDTRFHPATTDAGDKIESVFNFVMFDIPAAYGMYPGRPLRVLGVLVAFFTVVYLIPLNTHGSGGIWLVSTDRLGRRSVRNRPVVRRVTARRMSRRLLPALRGRWWMLVPVRVAFRLVALALYFSVVSAVAIGWRELNLGTWITRLQRREYTLRGTGWVRTASGIQALLSVYLVALWVLTYFGRPFE